MSASAEARAFPHLLPHHQPAETTRPADPMDPHGPQQVIVNPGSYFDMAAYLAHCEADRLAQRDRVEAREIEDEREQELADHLRAAEEAVEEIHQEALDQQRADEEAEFHAQNAETREEEVSHE